MRILQWFFTLVGILVIAGGVFFGLWMIVSRIKTVTPAEVSMLDPDAIRSAAASAQIIGKYVTMTLISLAFIMQFSAWLAASLKLSLLKKAEHMPVEDRILQLDAIEVYFDLPLYLGLLGSVVSFMVITLFPSAGIMFAYTSTALGILVSVILRLGYLTPYRQKLIAIRSQN